MGPKRPAVLAAVAVLFLAGAVLPASGRVRAARPITVRMKLYVGAAPAGAIPQFEWRVATNKNEWDLKIMALDVYGGGGATPLDLDAAVSMYRISFRLAGDREAVRRLVNAPPGQLLDVRGLARLDGGARYLMLDAVSPVSPTPTP